MMLKHIKLTGYKGIEVVKILNLGQINVISGKNNSGKSSILEAMSIRDYYGLGKEIDESLRDQFKTFFKKFSTPSVVTSAKWYNSFLGNISAEKEMWFDSDIKNINEQIITSMNQTEYL